MANVWVAIAYVLITPLLIIFAWRYKENFKRTIHNIRYNGLSKSTKGNKLRNLKEQLYNKLNTIIKKNI